MISLSSTSRLEEGVRQDVEKAIEEKKRREYRETSPQQPYVDAKDPVEQAIGEQAVQKIQAQQDWSRYRDISRERQEAAIQQYESYYARAYLPLQKAQSQLRTEAVEAKKSGKDFEAGLKYSASLGVKAVESVFQGATAVARPYLLSETLKTVSKPESREALVKEVKRDPAAAIVSVPGAYLGGVLVSKPISKISRSIMQAEQTGAVSPSGPKAEFKTYKFGKTLQQFYDETAYTGPREPLYQGKPSAIGQDPKWDFIPKDPDGPVDITPGKGGKPVFDEWWQYRKVEKPPQKTGPAPLYEPDTPPMFDEILQSTKIKKPSGPAKIYDPLGGGKALDETLQYMKTSPQYIPTTPKADTSISLTTKIKIWGKITYGKYLDTIPLKSRKASTSIYDVMSVPLTVPKVVPKLEPSGVFGLTGLVPIRQPQYTTIQHSPTKTTPLIDYDPIKRIKPYPLQRPKPRPVVTPKPKEEPIETPLITPIQKTVPKITPKIIQESQQVRRQTTKPLVAPIVVPMTIQSQKYTPKSVLTLEYPRRKRRKKKKRKRKKRGIAELRVDPLKEIMKV